MRVSLTPDAEDDLWSIWSFNVDRYGLERADRYVAFLREGIARLAAEYDLGRRVEDSPSLRTMAFRRRMGGDGHIVVYEVDLDAERITVLHVFHTKQDVQGRLGDGR